MLLLIFGYYNPVVRLITDNLLHGINVGICFAVLGCLALGIIVGFFAISYLMKFLLKRYPSTVRESGEALAVLYGAPMYWVAAVCLFLIGLGLSLLLVRFAKKNSKEKEKTEKKS